MAEMHCNFDQKQTREILTEICNAWWICVNNVERENRQQQLQQQATQKPKKSSKYS